MKRMVSWFWSLLVILFGVSHANAANVTATFVDVSPSHTFTYSLNGVNHGTKAGVFNFANATGYLSGNLQNFCIEVAGAINSGDVVNFTVDQLANAPKPGSGMGA